MEKYELVKTVRENESIFKKQRIGRGYDEYRFMVDRVNKKVYLVKFDKNKGVEVINDCFYHSNSDEVKGTMIDDRIVLCLLDNDTGYIDANGRQLVHPKVLYKVGQNFEFEHSFCRHILISNYSENRVGILDLTTGKMIANMVCVNDINNITEEELEKIIGGISNSNSSLKVL